MDFLPDKEHLVIWLHNYSGFALFGLLALGIIALPVPEETLLVITGLLLENGTLEFPGTLLGAYGGSLCGITVSYLLGRTAGLYVVDKIGPWVGLNHSRMRQVHNWFERYGKWTLFFGYFVPGVRHFTGLTAGIAKLEYHEFALFAYTGGIMWVTLFLTIGYFFGYYWLAVLEALEPRMELVIIASILLLGAFLGVRYYLKRRCRS